MFRKILKSFFVAALVGFYSWLLWPPMATQGSTELRRLDPGPADQRKIPLPHAGESAIALGRSSARQALAQTASASAARELSSIKKPSLSKAPGDWIRAVLKIDLDSSDIFGQIRALIPGAPADEAEWLSLLLEAWEQCPAPGEGNPCRFEPSRKYDSWDELIALYQERSARGEALAAAQTLLCGLDRHLPDPAVYRKCLDNPGYDSEPEKPPGQRVRDIVFTDFEEGETEKVLKAEGYKDEGDESLLIRLLYAMFTQCEHGTECDFKIDQPEAFGPWAGMIPALQDLLARGMFGETGALYQCAVFKLEGMDGGDYQECLEKAA